MPNADTSDNLGGVIRITVILKAAGPMLFDEQTDLRKNSRIFPRSGPATSRQPVIEARDNFFIRTHVRREYARKPGGCSGISNKGKPPRHTPHLLSCILRTKRLHAIVKPRSKLCNGLFPVFVQPLQEGAPDMSVMLPGKLLEAIGDGPGIGQAVQFGKHPHINGNTHKADFLPCTRLESLLRELFRKADFPRGEEQQAPRVGLSEARIFAGTSLAHAVGYQVAALGKHLGVHLPNFIEDKQIVVVQDADAFKPVVVSRHGLT